MARFYAKFDGGSVSALDNVNGAGGYFTQRRIAATSASGALLRDEYTNRKSNNNNSPA